MVRRTLSGVVIAGLALGLTAFAQQETSSSSAPPPQAQNESGQTQSTEKPEKKPSKIKKILKRAAPNCARIAGRPETCWSESGQEKEARKKQEEERAQQQQPPLPPSKPAPRSDDSQSGESSSRSNVDLSPPPGDAAEHEGAAISDVEELHSWDPHKAMKNVEVGDFYFKRGNYGAAESRYAEALLWKPNDAIATYRLAESQEKLGKFGEALKNYNGYLKILPKGEFAELARQGIARLSAKTPITSPAEGKMQSKAPTSPSERTPR